MKALFLITALFGFTSCSIFSNVGCTVETTVSGAIASGLSNALNCSNPGQVLVDVTALVAKTNICTAPTAKITSGKAGGSIASLICPTLASLASTELGGQIPATWQCNPGNSTLSTTLTTVCNLLPF